MRGARCALDSVPKGIKSGVGTRSALHAHAGQRGEQGKNSPVELSAAVVFPRFLIAENSSSSADGKCPFRSLTPEGTQRFNPQTDCQLAMGAVPCVSASLPGLLSQSRVRSSLAHALFLQLEEPFYH